jgi:hypothetical protein
MGGPKHGVRRIPVRVFVVVRVDVLPHDLTFGVT